MQPKEFRQLARQRETDAWALKVKGWTQVDIASKLGMSQPAVSRALARAEARALAELTEDVERVKTFQTAQLIATAKAAWEGWERSKLPTKTAKRTRGGKDGATVELTRKTTAGDPRFLAEFRGALADIRRIWGAERAETILSLASIADDAERARATYVVDPRPDHLQLGSSRQSSK